jgi:hypothetical protein
MAVNIEKIIQKVTAGLLAMSGPPDAFVFCDYAKNWTWEPMLIKGFMVFHASITGETSIDGITHTIPFIPIWRDFEAIEQETNTYLFNKAYLACN